MANKRPLIIDDGELKELKSIDCLNIPSGVLSDGAETRTISELSIEGHGHSISDVSNLQDDLDGKASTIHNHNWTDINDFTGSSINDIEDVSITSITSDQILKYNIDGTWKNSTLGLNELNDVNSGSFLDGKVLSYDQSNSCWEAIDLPSGVSSFIELTDTPSTHIYGCQLCSNGSCLTWMTPTVKKGTGTDSIYASGASSANGNYSSAIGSGAYSNGLRSVSYGSGAGTGTNANDSISLGNNSFVSVPYSAALGYQAMVLFGSNSVAIGDGTVVCADKSIGIGSICVTGNCSLGIQSYVVTKPVLSQGNTIYIGADYTGVGCLTPSHKLSVDGCIISQGIISNGHLDMCSCDICNIGNSSLKFVDSAEIHSDKFKSTGCLNLSGEVDDRTIQFSCLGAPLYWGDFDDPSKTAGQPLTTIINPWIGLDDFAWTTVANSPVYVADGGSNLFRVGDDLTLVVPVGSSMMTSNANKSTSSGVWTAKATLESNFHPDESATIMLFLQDYKTVMGTFLLMISATWGATNVTISATDSGGLLSIPPDTSVTVNKFDIQVDVDLTNNLVTISVDQGGGMIPLSGFNGASYSAGTTPNALGSIHIQFVSDVNQPIVTIDNVELPGMNDSVALNFSGNVRDLNDVIYMPPTDGDVLVYTSSVNKWIVSSPPSEFNNGGECRGYNRVLGNTDFYSLEFITDNQTRLCIECGGDICVCCNLGVMGNITGAGATASGIKSFAIGDGATATCDNSVAIGFGNHATGSSSTAMGVNTTASGVYSFGIGLDGNLHTLSQGSTMAIMGGKVGIGCLTPTQTLEVDGQVKATSFDGDGSALTNLPASSLEFTDLTDTPSSYTANCWLKVNGDGNALEFVTTPALASHTHDTSCITSGTLGVSRGGTGMSSYTGQGDKFVVVNPSGTGLTVANITMLDLNVFCADPIIQATQSGSGSVANLVKTSVGGYALETYATGGSGAVSAYLCGDIGVFGIGIYDDVALEMCAGTVGVCAWGEVGVCARGNVDSYSIKAEGNICVTGGIQLGNSGCDISGMIRWSGSDFEGYKGTGWVSLTNIACTTFISLCDTPSNYCNGCILCSTADGISYMTLPTGGDFSDGGDTAGANRTLGNNDAYGLGLETTGVTKINIPASGAVEICCNLDMCNFSICNINNSSLKFADGSIVSSTAFDTSGNVNATCLNSQTASYYARDGRFTYGTSDPPSSGMVAGDVYFKYTA